MVRSLASKVAGLAQGFTLLELCVVLIVVGMLMSFSVMPMKMTMARGALDDTQENMDAAQEALNVYFEMNGHYPCPALRGLTPDDEAFGKAQENCFSGGGNRSGAGGRDKGTQSVEGREGKRVRIGILPFRSLGLNDAEGLDGWDRLLQYAVTEELTDAAYFDQRAGAIAVVAEDLKSRVEPAATVQYVLFSTGETGAGGFGSGGAQGDKCLPKIREGENCDDDAIFMDSPLSKGGRTRGRSDPPEEFFDDYIRYVQYNRAVNEKNGLLFYYKGACPEFFREVPDVPNDLDIVTLRYTPEGDSGSRIQRPQSRGDDRKRLCFSPRYGVHYLRLDLGGSQSACPSGWTYLGYVYNEDSGVENDGYDDGDGEGGGGGSYTPLQYKACGL